MTRIDLKLPSNSQLTSLEYFFIIVVVFFIKKRRRKGIEHKWRSRYHFPLFNRSLSPANVPDRLPNHCGLHLPPISRLRCRPFSPLTVSRPISERSQGRCCSMIDPSLSSSHEELNISLEIKVGSNSLVHNPTKLLCPLVLKKHVHS